jgi:hypothetical protein
MAGEIKIELNDDAVAVKVEVIGDGKPITGKPGPGPINSDNICMWVKTNPTCVWVGGHRY